MIRSLKLLTQETQPQTGVDIERAFELCTEITRDHSKSFYFSTGFLPAEKRKAIRAFYAFCRTTDDTVDVLAQSDAEARPHLDAWRRAARLACAEQHNPVLAAWSLTRDAYDVPQRYIEELIDGCEMDLSVKRYETWEQLQRYCYCVASTVGLVSMHIIGVNNDDDSLLHHSRQPAIALGIALQLTNILRDVGEDLGRNRIYLPQEDLCRFGVSEDDLHAGVVTDRFRALMKFEVERTHALYEESMPAIGNLKPDGRVAVGAALMLYRGILDKIVANDYDVFNKRAYVGTAEKLQRMPAIVWKVKRMQPEW
jgi:phytoene synthase